MAAGLPNGEGLFVAMRPVGRESADSSGCRHETPSFVKSPLGAYHATNDNMLVVNEFHCVFIELCALPRRGHFFQAKSGKSVGPCHAGILFCNVEKAGMTSREQGR
jgi:hypothetical protein